MDDNTSKIPQKSVSAWYFVAPILIGLTYLFIRLIVNVNTESAKWFDGFLWAIAVIIGAGLISGIIFWALANKIQKPVGREFNGREFCREAIRKELLVKDHIRIEFFIGVQDSHRDIRNWGADGKTKIYSELVKTKRTPPGYLLVAMNMEKSREDDISYDHVPMNYNSAFLDKKRYDICNGMADKPERRQSRVVEESNALLGSSRTEKTDSPIDDDDEELMEE